MINDTMRTILDRRSVRSYQKEQIPEVSLKIILDAGKYAASALNRQPWHFTAVQNEELLDEISESVRETMLNSGKEHVIEKAKKPDYHCFYHAPTVIIVSGDDSAYARVDCANAAQNMCLSAVSLELGSCYIASFINAFTTEKGPELLQKLQIPEGYTPYYVVAVGYTAGDYPEAPLRKDHVNYVK